MEMWLQSVIIIVQEAQGIALSGRSGRHASPTFNFDADDAFQELEPSPTCVALGSDWWEGQATAAKVAGNGGAGTLQRG